MALVDAKMRTALVLVDGPRWEIRAFGRVKRGEVFLLVEADGAHVVPPFVATSEVRKPADNNEMIDTESLHGLTKDQISVIYGPARRSGLSHECVVRGLIAMREVP